MFAMSAKLSFALFVLVISSFAAASADGPLTGNVSVRLLREKTRYILVEEVDKNGRTEVKELELPDYDDSEEAREDEKRRREQRDEYRSAVPEVDGGESFDREERRRCLTKWRRWLRSSYRRWKEAVRRAMKVMDARIRFLDEENREGFKGENLRKG